jgi:hypothetical protein
VKAWNPGGANKAQVEERVKYRAKLARGVLRDLHLRFSPQELEEIAVNVRKYLSAGEK